MQTGELGEPMWGIRSSTEQGGLFFAECIAGPMDGGFGFVVAHDEWAMFINVPTEELATLATALAEAIARTQGNGRKKDGS